jgi:hypothetical protein
MNKRPPITLRRIVVEFAMIVLLQFALAHVLMHFRLLDHLLSPGRDSGVALGVTTAFLLLRMFVLLFAPGWFLARLWLWMTRAKRA